jgi:Mg2+-importing ATPase
MNFNNMKFQIMNSILRNVNTTRGQSPEIVQLLLRLGKSSPEEALKEMRTSESGLTSSEAKRRLAQYGENKIIREKPTHWGIQFIKAFLTPFNLILIALAVVSCFTDIVFAAETDRNWTKIIILGVMISVSSILRFWQEFKSQKIASKLKELIKNTALVKRQDWGDQDAPQNGRRTNGEKREIPINELVPGDIVYLSAGDMIPADMRLISSKDLFVTQSALTGESAPIEKFAVPPTDVEKIGFEQDKKDFNPLDLNTLVFMGTTVVSGSGVGVVIATGQNTYFGSIAKNITGQRELTSFDKGVNKISMVLIYFMLVMVPVVFLINAVSKHNWFEALLFALAVAVGLTPEMLPLVVTANLAKGAVEMAKQKVIIKKLNAIQNLGAMDVLCTDKTGTITENRIVLVQHIDVNGTESDRVLDLAYINSRLQTGLKNLMDTAIIQHREEMGDIEEELRYHKIDEIPFDFSRRRMSVIVEREKHDDHLLICKGAVEEVESLCSHVEIDGQIIEITDAILKKTKTMVKKMNQKGLRVLAIAYKNISAKKERYNPQDEQGLTLVGFVGFLDPPKESAKKAIDFLRQLGVQVKIITGDNEIVTETIARAVGLVSPRILRGDQIEKLSDAELENAVEKVHIFAKIDPLQKARIVKALKNNGHTVGYLGDGVNDAAALQASDVGISVDNGVDIAKESADIILLENDLMVLGQGVVQGRTVYGNIMKYIKMAASSNFGNVFSVLVASIFLPFLPMLPIQLLTQNLLYDISQLSIPWDKMDEDFLKKPRKWQSGGLARFMIFIGPISSIFDITTFLLMWFVFKANTPEAQSLFQSGWFVEGLLSQTLIVHIIRTQKIPFVQSIAAKPVLVLTAAIMAIGIFIPFSHFGKGIGLQPLPTLYFPWLILTLVCYLALAQVVKIWYIRRFGEWL